MHSLCISIMTSSITSTIRKRSDSMSAFLGRAKDVCILSLLGPVMCSAMPAHLRYGATADLWLLKACTVLALALASHSAAATVLSDWKKATSARLGCWYASPVSTAKYKMYGFLAKKVWRVHFS